MNSEVIPAQRRDPKDPFALIPSARTRMYFHFAVLSAAGGVVLGLGQDASEIAVLSVFFALFGFLFVDYLRLIALPQLIGYIAMGAAAAYCIQDFWLLEQRGQTQMVSVALLLVLVQGILMMQRKSRRILEQLAVFCLLELVVAAIFNDAISFGLMVFPITMIGASALCLLGVIGIAENVESNLLPAIPPTPRTRLGRWVQRFGSVFRRQPQVDYPVAITSAETASFIDSSAGKWARLPLFVAGPAVILIASTFFYLLPRRIDPSKDAFSSPAMVGFDDEIRLEQLGKVMQNSKRALKVRLMDSKTDLPYVLKNGMYLRGKVLERYSVDYSTGRPIAKWVSSPLATPTQPRLPAGYEPQDPVRRKLFDRVSVEITCESMSRPALFAIAPYFASRETDADVMHVVDRWTLTRQSDSPPFPAMTYQFNTHTFQDGVQSELIPRARGWNIPDAKFALRTPFSNPRSASFTDSLRRYHRQLTAFDRRQMPTVGILADEVMSTIPDSERTVSRIAKEFSYFLATDSRFQYTLDLSAEPIPTMDPIEQFLAVDRKGHCQYFSSALAMMLRSVGIPCRVVVGYRTDEFNKIGGYYIARQQHAHAWVEALVAADQFPKSMLPAGSKLAESYWLRLDATPAASLFQQHQDRSGAQGLMNLANNFWEDYVVDMNRNRQNDSIQEAAQFEQMRSTYDTFWRQMKQNMNRFNFDRPNESYSVSGSLMMYVLAGACFVMSLFMLAKLRPKGFVIGWFDDVSRWFTGRRKKPGYAISIRFYADAIALLRRAGVERQEYETPDELLKRMEGRFPSLGVITKSFNDYRYGGRSEHDEAEIQNALNELRQRAQHG
ncbi:DUF3488 and transglutaminase-like domain-containing protein [Stieleria sp. JC731]|uniref:transglutaminase TgpA family protein n=1 Tax=Pirellulaceae TaxID=2691357 RepID=UPI001E618D34|nr:transglutaminaseTgpA domain-containing protein [Stieleria sp. JC731]MCC9604058.1 DUF3488 and transglutaminase-like domain-containing protein [Stieleria sp. JC731]